MASFERGIRKMPALMPPELAKLFDTSVDELVGLKDTETKRGPIPSFSDKLYKLPCCPRLNKNLL
jgi:hypothetical protein